jgi:hypothetical protein
MKKTTQKSGTKSKSEVKTGKTTKAYAKGPFVLIRSRNAGVFVGTLIARNDAKQLVKLHNAIRIWYWDGAFTLSQLAMEGVTKPENCKFSVPVTEQEIFEVIEIIPVTAAAEANIKNVESCRA